jgi:hypothetical protein
MACGLLLVMVGEPRRVTYVTLQGAIQLYTATAYGCPDKACRLGGERISGSQASTWMTVSSVPGSPSNVQTIFDVGVLAWFQVLQGTTGCRVSRTAMRTSILRVGRQCGRMIEFSDKSFKFASEQYRPVEYEAKRYTFFDPFMCPGGYKGGLREGTPQQEHAMIATDGRKCRVSLRCDALPESAAAH